MPTPAPDSTHALTVQHAQCGACLSIAILCGSCQPVPRCSTFARSWLPLGQPGSSDKPCPWAGTQQNKVLLQSPRPSHAQQPSTWTQTCNAVELQRSRWLPGAALSTNLTASATTGCSGSSPASVQRQNRKGRLSLPNHPADQSSPVHPAKTEQDTLTAS